MNDNSDDLYGLASTTRIEDERERMAVFGSESSAISDAASIIAEEFHRRSPASTIVSGGIIRERIASHPLFTKLLGAYLDCRKVGAPPEIANELEEIRRNNGEPLVSAVTSDPELDDFMETYYDILVKYKSDLSRPLEEATTFLSEMQAQLNDLISKSSASTSYVSGRRRSRSKII